MELFTEREPAGGLSILRWAARRPPGFYLLRNELVGNEII